MDKLKSTVGAVTVNVDLSRINKNVPDAQKALNIQIVADSTPFIPFRQGAIRSRVSYPDGLDGNLIQWGGGAVGVPYANYQYMGIVYGPNFPQYDAAGNIIGWASPPKKYPTERKLQYHTPGTSDHWVEEAKNLDLKDWVDLVGKKLTKE